MENEIFEKNYLKFHANYTNIVVKLGTRLSNMIVSEGRQQLVFCNN